MSSPLILAIDQGTSSTKCLLVDGAARIVAQGQVGLGQQTPKPGWVEQDADEIWNSVRRAVAATVAPEAAGRVIAAAASRRIWMHSATLNSENSRDAPVSPARVAIASSRRPPAGPATGRTTT